ncbi:hypothetical protein [Paenibacillus elgii]|uniref:hypothetical protein n=1 Tax=Paenibacillus elgii TaxID=189691 RepID=UPI001CB8DC0D|nr:hypothetical protein [Paenibacillus elgii]
MTEQEDRFEEDGNEQEEQDDSGFARVYMVELLYKTKPELSREALYEKMEAYTGQVDVPDDEDAEAEEDKADVPGLAVWEAEDPDPSNDTLMFFILTIKSLMRKANFRRKRAYSGPTRRRSRKSTKRLCSKRGIGPKPARRWEHAGIPCCLPISAPQAFLIKNGWSCSRMRCGLCWRLLRATPSIGAQATKS